MKHHSRNATEKPEVLQVKLRFVMEQKWSQAEHEKHLEALWEETYGNLIDCPAAGCESCFTDESLLRHHVRLSHELAAKKGGRRHEAEDLPSGLSMWDQQE